MKSDKISEAVVRRLPVYLRYLNALHKREVATVSSQELGQRLDLNPAQIRKDLAYFGDFTVRVSAMMLLILSRKYAIS